MKVNIYRIKLAVLLGFCFLAILAFSFGKGLSGRAHAAISGPDPGKTGAPGELTCTDCHNTTAGSGQFTITAPASYTPGQTYSIQVRHVTADTTRRRWGFELTSLAGTTAAGTFVNQNANTRTLTANGRRYIEQTSAGTFQNQQGGALWTFNWTAPTTNVGPVTFYAAGLQANNNGSESGDQTYTTNVIVQPAVATPTRPLPRPLRRRQPRRLHRPLLRRQPQRPHRPQRLRLRQRRLRRPLRPQRQRQLLRQLRRSSRRQRL